MRSEKPRKTRQNTKQPPKTRPVGKEQVSLFCSAAVLGSTAINYLAQDPELAESEASDILQQQERGVSG